MRKRRCGTLTEHRTGVTRIHIPSIDIHLFGQLIRTCARIPEFRHSQCWNHGHSVAGQSIFSWGSRCII